MRTLIATPKAPILVATFATSFSIISLFTGCGASSFNPTPSKTTPTITWNTPNVVPVGTVLSSTQLDATANAPGTFVYSPAPNVILSTAGTTKLSVTFTPMDTVNYTTATATVSITVDPAVLTVTAASASRAYGAANPTFIDASPVMLTGTLLGCERHGHPDHDSLHDIGRRNLSHHGRNRHPRSIELLVHLRSRHADHHRDI